MVVPDNTLKNFYKIVYLLGIFFLDIHLLNLQLEFSPDLQYVIPVFDLLILLGAWYLVHKDKTGLVFIPLILFCLPLLALAIILKDKILSEYYFWGHVIKTLLIVFFIGILIKKENFSTIRNTRFVFFFFLLLLILPNLFYVVCDFSIANFDSTRHAKNVFYIFNMIFEDKDGLFASYMYYDLYPSLAYLLCIPFILLFGKSGDSLTFSIILFWLPLSFYYTQKIFNKVFKVSKEYSIVISFIYHSNILFLSFYKQFLLDFQPVALLPVYYYYIYKSAFFHNKKYSIISGIILGIGFLVKQSFLLYAAPVLIFIAVKILWNTWRNRNNDRLIYLHLWKNILLHAVFGFLLIIPWFGGWQYMYNFEMSFAPEVAKGEGDPEPISLASFIWYIPNIVYTYSIPFIFLLIHGWYHLVKRKRFLNHQYAVGFAAVLIYIALTLNYNKDLRYIAGLFFFIGFGFCGLYYLKNNVREFVIWTSVIVCMFYSIQLVSWEKIRIPGIKLSNYALPESPESPVFKEEARAVTAFEKLFLSLPISQEKKILSHKPLKEDGYYVSYYLTPFRNINALSNLVEYDSIIHGGVNMGQELYRSEYNVITGVRNDGNPQYLFGRNSLYPSFYLFAFYKNGNTGSVRVEGFDGSLQADCRLTIRKFSGDSLVEAQEGWIISRKFDFTLNTQVDRIEIGLDLFHHLGRWQLIYLNKFTPYYKNNYLQAGFIPYSKDVNQNNNWIISLK